jgi:hypothetical protein
MATWREGPASSQHGEKAGSSEEPRAGAGDQQRQAWGVCNGRALGAVAEELE